MLILMVKILKCLKCIHFVFRTNLKDWTKTFLKTTIAKIGGSKHSESKKFKNLSQKSVKRIDLNLTDFFTNVPFFP